jgi:hypothetical protein
MIAYSVWVGGSEVNDHYITDLDEAEDIANCWKGRGYDDVAVEEIDLTSYMY